ncbi:MAG: hypothetical protein GKR89_05495 [Candidatus Latescibacteria bacterium]|nr:hypothetical protein [Candidatus Latescibacterota bacterium]
MSRTGLLLVGLLLTASIAAAQNWMEGRPTLVLKGEAAQVAIDLGGGSIADFHLLQHGLNPLQWDSWSFSETPDEPPPPDPRSMGHFLCLDRWGPASEAEIAHGMGWHGEATRVNWSLDQEAWTEGGFVRGVMSASLPMAGLQVERSIRLAQKGAFFTVREEVTNTNPLGRVYNIVQHPTIGPPFLDETTVVDANARKGFVQGGTLPNPEEPSVFWPRALDGEGTSVSIRYLTDSADPGVVSYVIDDEYGWTTASNAGQGLLIGYIWKTADYPWFDAWRNVRDGKPFARGLEFGTSGLHQPFPVLVEKGRIFGRKIFNYIDADETQVFSYANFLVEIPDDYQGVATLTYTDGALTLTERGGSPERNLVLQVGDLFAE